MGAAIWQLISRRSALVWVMGLGCALRGAVGYGQDSKQWIDTLLAHEAAASEHRGHYTYESEERSDRTGGHLWTERVAETAWGRVRYLVLEDGQPLTGARLQAERTRLAADAADPEDFKRRESAKADDEQHARQMMQLLPKAFLFDAPKHEADGVRIDFHPNPDYSPSGLEERVLHSMVGSVVIDEKLGRTREIEGRMPQDVSIGFGLLATVKAGSNFSTRREHVDGNDWKTESVHTDINGKALMLKTIARKQEMRRWNYKKIPDGLTMADALKLVEQAGS